MKNMIFKSKRFEKIKKLFIKKRYYIFGDILR